MADTPQVLVPLQVPIAQSEDSHGQVQVVILSPPTPDTIVPVIGNFNPPLNSPLVIGQSLSFDVTDDSGSFRRVIVHAVFADGIEEVVHNGDSFRGLYGAGSSLRSIIALGFNYAVFRKGGWPSKPNFTIFAIDQAGNEAA